MLTTRSWARNRSNNPDFRSSPFPTFILGYTDPVNRVGSGGPNIGPNFVQVHRTETTLVPMDRSHRDLSIGTKIITNGLMLTQLRTNRPIKLLPDRVPIFTGSVQLSIYSYLFDIINPTCRVHLDDWYR